MKLQQLSVFLENKPGSLKKSLAVLADAKINISTLALAETKDYGILRLVIKDWEKAKSALEQGGFTVRQTEVLAVEVEDRPGGLATVLAPVEAAGVNVEYMYAYSTGTKAKAVLIFRFSDLDKAIAALKGAGMNVLENLQVFGP
ncbi:MAG: ACT domain-containing protein [Anaerolineales bacterium]|nr:ACT domain-containing protein [Anaerolineales bacterium]